MNFMESALTFVNMTLNRKSRTRSCSRTVQLFIGMGLLLMVSVTTANKAPYREELPIKDRSYIGNWVDKSFRQGHSFVKGYNKGTSGWRFIFTSKTFWASLFAVIAIILCATWSADMDGASGFIRHAVYGAAGIFLGCAALGAALRYSAYSNCDSVQDWHNQRDQVKGTFKEQADGNNLVWSKRVENLFHVLMTLFAVVLLITVAAGGIPDADFGDIFKKPMIGLPLLAMLVIGINGCPKIFNGKSLYQMSGIPEKRAAALAEGKDTRSFWKSKTFCLCIAVFIAIIYALAGPIGDSANIFAEDGGMSTMIRAITLSTGIPLLITAATIYGIRRHRGAFKGEHAVGTMEYEKDQKLANQAIATFAFYAFIVSLIAMCWAIGIAGDGKSQGAFAFIVPLMCLSVLCLSGSLEKYFVHADTVFQMQEAKDATIQDTVKSFEDTITDASEMKMGEDGKTVPPARPLSLQNMMSNGSDNLGSTEGLPFDAEKGAAQPPVKNYRRRLSMLEKVFNTKK